MLNRFLFFWGWFPNIFNIISSAYISLWPSTVCWCECCQNWSSGLGLRTYNQFQKTLFWVHEAPKQIFTPKSQYLFLHAHYTISIKCHRQYEKVKLRLIKLSRTEGHWQNLIQKHSLQFFHLRGWAKFLNACWSLNSEVNNRLITTTVPITLIRW